MKSQHKFRGQKLSRETGYIRSATTGTRAGTIGACRTSGHSTRRLGGVRRTCVGGGGVGIRGGGRVGAGHRRVVSGRRGGRDVTELDTVRNTAGASLNAKRKSVNLGEPRIEWNGCNLLAEPVDGPLQ